MSTKKVTREELYEQVWRTPVSRLAAEYGVSDVALAKTCRRLNVPRPGRGYWARLAAGVKQKRPPLPTGRTGEDEWTFLERAENPTPRAIKPEAPKVPVPKNLRRADEAVGRLGAMLGEASKDQYDRLIIGGRLHPVFAVTIATHRRALLLLDALSKAFTRRGHTVILQEEGAGEGKRSMLAVVVAGDTIALSFVELLERREHELTPGEQERVAKGNRYGIPKYDQFAGGRLRISLHDSRLSRSAWSDTGKHRLEQHLGSVLLAAEAEAERRRLQRIADEQRHSQEEQRRREQEQERLRQREREARAKYQDGLVKDLKQMARTWTEAEEVRAFLRALHGAVPVEERNEGMVAWLHWAATCAEVLDPLARPNEIPKALHPESEKPAPSSS